MKKLFGIITALTLCVCAFAGCGLTGGDKPSDDDGKDDGKIDKSKFPYYTEVDEATYKFDLRLTIKETLSITKRCF